MNCPKCDYGYATTIECRNVGEAKRVRKLCSGCGHRYTIYELFDRDFLILRNKQKKYDKIKELMEDEYAAN